MGEQGGKIDNPDDFLADMAQLDKFEQKMVRAPDQLRPTYRMHIASAHTHTLVSGPVSDIAILSDCTSACWFTRLHHAQVVKVLVLCSILDGRLRRRERAFYEATVEACGFANNQQRVKLIAKKFRGMQPITLLDFAEVTDMPPLPATVCYYLNEARSSCMLLLAC
jgi:hypothetical protein